MYSNEAYEVDSTTTDEVVDSIKALQEIECEMTLKDSELKNLKRTADEYRSDIIPQAMGACTKWENEDYRVSVRDDVYASIYADKKPEAFRYLESINKGTIIKREISVQFGVSALTDAMLEKVLPKIQELVTKALNDELEETYPERNATVNPKIEKGYKVESATLKKLVKDRLLEGYTMPDDLFSVMPTRKAFIKKLTF